MTENFDPNTLNNEAMIMWFDDLGTGNDEYRFLSNFYAGAPITLPGVTWEELAIACGRQDMIESLPGVIQFKTGEHAFAAMKFWGSDLAHFADIVFSQDPGTAKALGRSRKHPLRADWEIAKLDVMAAVTRAKYTLTREEGCWLLETGDRFLMEGTFWGDEVWGVDLDAPLTPGRNWLGTLLMARRAELRAARAWGLDFFVGETVKHNTNFAKETY